MFLKTEPSQVSVKLQSRGSLYFSFTDGDADLGNDPASGKQDLYLKDLRFPNADFKGNLLPDIDKALMDPTKGVAGTIRFDVPLDLLLPRNDSPAHFETDTIVYEAYLMDKAGNTSNHVITSPIIVYNQL